MNTPGPQFQRVAAVLKELKPMKCQAVSKGTIYRGAAGPCAMPWGVRDTPFQGAVVRLCGNHRAALARGLKIVLQAPGA